MMTNIANSLGVGSGINVNLLVSDLAAASRAPKIERLDALAKASQSRISAVARARADLDSFADTLANLVQSGSLSSLPVASVPEALKADALPGAQLGGLAAEIEIRQLARAQTTHSGLIATPETLLGSGGLTLRVGGVAYPVGSATGEVSLATLADAINNSGSGVRAHIIPDQGQFRLILKGETGAANSFSVEAAAGADAAVSAFAATGLTMAQAASDAVVRIDGVEFTRPSNRISDAVPGVSLTLQKAEPGTIVALGSTRPADALKQTISDFVTVFNQLQAGLKEARKAVGGAANLRALDQQLVGLIGKQLTSQSPLKSLSDIGVALDRTGSLTLDLPKLDAALARDADAVEALFNPPRSNGRTAATDPGLAGALDAVRDGALARGGLLESLDKRLQAEAAQLSKSREAIEARETAYAARLQKQYATLDARLNAFKATQAYLEQQIKLWSNEG